MSKIDSLKSKIELNPNDGKSYFQLAKLYRGNRQYEEAKEILLAFLRQKPEPEDMKDAFLWLAELFLEQGDFQKALDYWNNVVSVAENSVTPPLYELHGSILIRQYRNAELDSRDETLLDQAIKSFQYATTLNPDSQLLASIYLGLGLAYHDKDLLDVATDYLNQALALQPEDRQLAAECHLQLGLMELWDHENPEKAIPLLRLALETSPFSPPSSWLAHGYWCLSHALVQIGKYQDAIVTGEKSLEATDPNDCEYPMALVTAHSVLGWAYYHIAGKEDLAIHHYFQALVLEEDPVIYRYLGELYFYKDEFSQALEMFTAVLHVAPGYQYPGDIYNAIGVCLVRMERYQEALVYLGLAQQEQATITFKPFELYYNIGMCYWHLGQHDEAIEAFKTALGLMHPKDKDYRRIEWYLRQVMSCKSPPAST